MKEDAFFNEIVPYIVIILGGDLPKTTEIKNVIDNANYCICADSGADIARFYGRIPDYLVGDMDSIDLQTLQWCNDHKVSQKTFRPEKDYTDGELAIDFAIKYAKTNNIGFIKVVGGYGNRFDHTLANIYIGKKALDAGLRIEYYNETSFIYLLKGNLCQEVEILNGKTVSLLPFDGNAEGVTIKGFKYPLNDGTLVVDKSLGISNELISDIGSISMTRGYLMIVQNR